MDAGASPKTNMRPVKEGMGQEMLKHRARYRNARRHRIHALRATPVLLIFLTACLGPAPRHISLPAGKYVALGDSFSAGEGVPPFSSTDTCDRSRQSYSEILGSLNGPVLVTPDFVACSGAVIADFSSTNHSNNSEPPQRLRLFGADVGLVTVTFGGNDVGFAGIIADCAARTNPALGLPPLTGRGSCHDSEEGNVEKNLHAIDGSALSYSTLDPNVDHPANLRDLYREIRMLAPRARILVLGYPHEFQENPEHDCAHIDSTDELWANQLSDRLNALIQANVVAARARVEYVPRSAGAESYFLGHALCGGSEHFNNPDDCLGQVCVPNPFKLWFNQVFLFHPNRDGQKDYANAILDELETAGPPIPAQSPAATSATTSQATTVTPTTTTSTGSSPAAGPTCDGISILDYRPGDQCAHIAGMLTVRGVQLIVGDLASATSDEGRPELCALVTGTNTTSTQAFLTTFGFHLESAGSGPGSSTTQSGAAVNSQSSIGGTLNKVAYLEAGTTRSGTVCFPALPTSHQQVVIIYEPGSQGRSIWVK